MAVDYLLPVIPNAIADGIYRTLIIGGVGSVLVYRLKISPDANSVLDGMIDKLRKKG